MFSVFAPCLGIDLGTANTLVFMKGEGIVLREPSVVAVKSDTKEIIAVGAEAKKMIGRTPGGISAVHPMRDGVISDLGMTEVMLKHFIRRTLPGGLFIRRSPRLVICVPCSITEIERRAIEEAARAAGARETVLLEEPMAAAMGAGLSIEQARGCMIVDIGGGTTEIAVISLGGIAASKSLRIAGNHMDEAIMRHVKKKYGMIIGESTAEQIKIEIGCVVETGGETFMDIKGRGVKSGLPLTVKISSSEIQEALLEPANAIVDAVKNVLEHTPPELAADIIDEGIVLTGGSSMLRGFNRLVAKATGMPIRLAKDPLDCVALGAGVAIDRLENAALGEELSEQAAQ